MQENFIDFERVNEEYGDMAKYIIETCEITCFDIKMEKLLQMMLNLDWIMV